MSDNSDELLQEVFWTSSLSVAVISRDGRLFLTSKAFRDSFSGMIDFSEKEECELLSFGGGEEREAFIGRLASLPPGERFSYSLRAPFAGVECELRVRVSAIRGGRNDRPLFLTEWTPAADGETYRKALNEIERKYRNLQENLPVGIYRAGEDGVLKTANRALVRMMGFDSFEQLQNAPLQDVWVNMDQRAEMIDRLRDEGSVLNYQVNLRRRDGSELIASFDARGTFDADGKLVYFDTIVQDITSRVLAQRELERLARTDSLTGLLNRQRLMERLEKEVERSTRYGRPLSVMIMDLDHFKEVNDKHGHLAGDSVLVSTAETVTGTLRKTDFAGRYGGEEFCVVLPETGMSGAADLAERLREAVKNTEHSIDGTSLKVTCSIGVAEASSEKAEETIAVADAALYRAKRSGRNRVERAGGET